MKKAIFPIDVEIGYKTDDEKEKKLEVITKLLSAIVKSKDKYNDVAKLNKYLSFIKGEKIPLSHYIMSYSLSIVFVILCSLIILDINIYNGELVSSVYLGGDSAYGYVLNQDGSLYFSDFKITQGCDDFYCVTDKGHVLRRLIDYYSFK